MAFDYKKEYPEFYLPKAKPTLVQIPEMRYIAVRGEGDPNAPDGAYKAAIGLLYGVAYTIKMSPRASHAIEGYFDYVVPPLEGFWWQAGTDEMDLGRKADFHWISVIRLPDFVRPEDFEWARGEAQRKKGGDYAAVEYLRIEEGLCAQMLHVGAFDAEGESIARLNAFIAEQGCAPDFSPERRHHEIYLSDARRIPPERMKTVIRLPVRRM